MNEEVNYEIEQVEKYLKEIEDMNIKNYEDFESTSIKNLAASMCVFSILNSCIELGEHLITLRSLETPLKYKDIFVILTSKKILSKKTGESLSNFMHLRNMLAHQYGRVDLNKVYKAIEQRNVFKNFIEEVKKEILKEI